MTSLAHFQMQEQRIRASLLKHQSRPVPEAPGEPVLLSPPKARLIVQPGAMWHGTIYGYNKRRCRCSPCTSANRRYRWEHPLSADKRAIYNQRYRAKQKES